MRTSSPRRAQRVFSTSPWGFSTIASLVTLIALMLATSARADDLPPLLHAAPLTTEGDQAKLMVAGIDRFLDQQILEAGKKRQAWTGQAVDARRQRLASTLGVRDARPVRVEMEYVATTDQPALVGKSELFEAFAVRWRAFGEVFGEGLLLLPSGREPLADVIAIPDADQTPEMIAGLAEGLPAESQFARRLVENGCRVIVPVLIDRHVEKRIGPGRKEGPELSNREFVYRTSFELGRHVIGYEVQKVLAALDWLNATGGGRKCGVFGYGEGGMLAMFSAAIEPRIGAACISGYFGQPTPLWKQPIERNIQGLLEQFGNRELALMIAPRPLVIEPSRGPLVRITGKNAAPGELTACEADKIRELDFAGANPPPHVAVVAPPTDRRFGTHAATAALVDRLGQKEAREVSTSLVRNVPRLFDPSPRQKRQFEQLVHHSQGLIGKSSDTRREFMKKLDTSSIVKYESSAKPYRELFVKEAMGRFDLPLSSPNPRARKIYDREKYTGYEVVLDVLPDVFAEGILLLPKDLKPGEKRPVIVCQHGLEGRPVDTIEPNKYYSQFAHELAGHGFVTFSPQNPYIFKDDFRTLVRKANPLNKTLWSIIIPQHQQIINYLKSLECVDPQRIAFYGLSYGGKSAMRLPAALTEYCLSICSGDFNEWVLKNASTAIPWSYVYTGEYEIFEWDLGSTFNYAEMAALIAPRPFMVERGHFDGVSSDEFVGWEYGKVIHLYGGLLKIGDRCAIEWFPGPHMINGKGTYEFLHKHLRWEKQ